MKNLVLAVGVSVLALAGCDNNANAQAQQVSADVGSPQGYFVVCWSTEKHSGL